MELFLDIECTNNKADIGYIVAIGIMKDGKVEVKFIESEIEEKEALIWFKQEIKGCDYIVTWYGSKFDIPFILSRAMVNGVNLDELSRIHSLDLCEFFRKNFIFSRNSLSEVAKILKIPKSDDISGKDVLNLYLRFLNGDRTAKEKIIEHCKSDLEVLEKIFRKVQPYLNITTKNP